VGRSEAPQKCKTARRIDFSLDFTSKKEMEAPSGTLLKGRESGTFLRAHFSLMAAVGGDGDTGGCGDARGRGRPSLLDYLAVENLAIAVAAQRASVQPDQTAIKLEAKTKEYYPQMLRDAAVVHG
jgi:hypothetical protein